MEEENRELSLVIDGNAVANNDAAAEDLLEILNNSAQQFAVPHSPEILQPIVLSDNDSPIGTTHKKRKLTITTPSPKSQRPPKMPIFTDDDDDGSTCSVCLEQWEMSGDHRLTSLKCGHLFGHSCIKRWLQECATGSKSCPSCKTKATVRDFRFLYAKKVCVVDNSEMIRVQTLLNDAKAELLRIIAERNMADFELRHQRTRVIKLQEENDQLRRQLLNNIAAPSSSGLNDEIAKLKKVKLFLENTIDISKVSGCRCLATSRWNNSLYVSQRSPQSLFPGFGIRFIDLTTMRPAHFMIVSSKPIRDIAVTDNYDNGKNYILATTMETCGRLYDYNHRHLLHIFRPVHDNRQSPVWSCTFDAHQSELVHFGGQLGDVFTFDQRNPNECYNYFGPSPSLESSPTINIVSIASNPSLMPYGGLVVCQLKQIIIYQYKDASRTSALEILVTSIEGPFSSMSYCPTLGNVLITTRSSKVHPKARHILAHFSKCSPEDEQVILVAHKIIQGSSTMPMLSKPAQYSLNADSKVLLTAYLQDSKQLTTWAIEENLRLQSMPMSDTVLDLCPLYTADSKSSTHLAALSDNKCRIFKVHEDKS